jgi:hypothetical protein
VNGRGLTRHEAIQLCRWQHSVSIEVAAKALGIGYKTALKRRKRDKHIADGVPVIEASERCWVVPSAAVLHALWLHNFTEGSPPAIWSAVETTEAGGRHTPASVTVPIRPTQGGSSGNSTRS